MTHRQPTRQQASQKAFPPFLSSTKKQPNMTTSITKLEDRAIVTLEGELDTAASRQVEQSLAQVYSYEDCDIFIDCSNLTYISSSGLRILLSIYKFTRRTGHKAVLMHINDDIHDTFAISGFIQLFTIEK